jgi:hypothetical protein
MAKKRPLDLEGIFFCFFYTHTRGSDTQTITLLRGSATQSHCYAALPHNHTQTITLLRGSATHRQKFKMCKEGCKEGFNQL